MNISSLHHFFTSSSHSLFSRPLFVFPFIFPNTTSSTSLLSSILQMCLNKFNFLSLIICMMFLLLPIFFLISSFVIFCCILHLEFFDSISAQMPSVYFLSFFFNIHVLHAYNTTLITQVIIMSRLVFMLMFFAFPDVLELCHYSCCSS